MLEYEATRGANGSLGENMHALNGATTIEEWARKHFSGGIITHKEDPLYNLLPKELQDVVSGGIHVRFDVAGNKFPIPRASEK